MKRTAFGFALSLALFATACGGTGPFVWIQDVSPAQLQEAAIADYVIKDGDMLTLRMFANGQPQDAIGGQQKLRSDGRIVVPLAGEFVAKGKKPAALAKEIEAGLKGQFQGPAVTILVDAPQPWGAPQPNTVPISVVGEVNNNCVCHVDPGANVLQVLAVAGGLSDFAATDKIFVVRKSLPQRIRFKLEDLRNGDKKSLSFAIQPGDVLVVE